LKLWQSYYNSFVGKR